MTATESPSTFAARIHTILVEFQERLLVEFRNASVLEVAGASPMRRTYTPDELQTLERSTFPASRPAVAKAKSRTKDDGAPSTSKIALLIPKILDAIAAAGAEGIRGETLRTALGKPSPRLFYRAITRARERDGVKTRGIARGMTYFLGGRSETKPAATKPRGKPGPKPKKKAAKAVKASTKTKAKTSKVATAKMRKPKEASKPKAKAPTAPPVHTTTTAAPANDAPKALEAASTITKSYALHLIERLKSLPEPKAQAVRYLETFGVKHVRDIPAPRLKDALERLEALEHEHGIENVHHYEETSTSTPPNGALSP